MVRNFFQKRHTRAGARPGTLVIPKESPAPVIRHICYDQQGIQESEISNVDDLKGILQPGSINWIDIQGFGDRSTMQQIGSIFHLHPLLLEDIVNVPQRPKAESYGDQLLVVVRMFRLEAQDDTGLQEIDMEQVSLVLAKGHVLTFQERHGDVLDPVRKRLRSGKGIIRTRGADYLAYAIADTIIDGYYPVLESVGDQLEALENDVIHNPSQDVLVVLNRLKNELINLRRAIWPQREAINALIRGDHELIDGEVSIYLRDTYDHCVQTSEVAEMFREMVTGLMNTYLSSVANRTNEVMKVLTVMASIFIPLSFLVGVYGMNFEYMPELHYQFSYPLLWSVMFGTAAGMLVFFWRKGWLAS